MTDLNSIKPGQIIRNKTTGVNYLRINDYHAGGVVSLFGLWVNLDTNKLVLTLDKDAEYEEGIADIIAEVERLTALNKVNEAYIEKLEKECREQESEVDRLRRAWGRIG